MSDGAVEPLGEIAPLKREEMDFLSDVAKRAYQSVPRHPQPIFLRTGNPRPLEGKLHVASLAFTLPDPKPAIKEVQVSGKCPWSPEPYKLVVYDGSGATDIHTITETFLKEAVRQHGQLHFVLLNELSQGFLQRVELESDWKALATKHRAYIVPGTFHCTEEFFGVAPIYSPDPGRHSFALKQNSAVKQDERIRTPDARELVVYETDYGNIVIWICLDVYDPGLVLKFLNMTNRFTGNREERKRTDREISLVLLPSYSKDSEDNIRNCMRTVSRFSKTAMVCANSFAQDHRRESYGFCGGEALDVLLEKEYVHPATGAPFCKATLYGVDLGLLGEMQARNYQDTGIFSSSFSSIINGGPFVIREIPD